MALFVEDPSSPLLHDHQLKGDRYGQRSINIGGDLRALYRHIDDQAVQFVAIDTHGNLYE